MRAALAVTFCAIMVFSDSAVGFATMPNAFDCYDKNDIQNRVNDAVVANTNPVCISAVHELAAARGTRVLG